MQYISDDKPFPMDENGKFLMDKTTELIPIWKVCEYEYPQENKEQLHNDTHCYNIKETSTKMYTPF